MGRQTSIRETASPSPARYSLSVPTRPSHPTDPRSLLSFSSPRDRRAGSTWTALPHSFSSSARFYRPPDPSARVQPATMSDPSDAPPSPVVGLPPASRAALPISKFPHRERPPTFHTVPAAPGVRHPAGKGPTASPRPPSRRQARREMESLHVRTALHRSVSVDHRRFELARVPGKHPDRQQLPGPDKRRSSQLGLCVEMSACLKTGCGVGTPTPSPPLESILLRS